MRAYAAAIAATALPCSADVLRAAHSGALEKAADVFARESIKDAPETAE
jgi:hypothetical protein